MNPDVKFLTSSTLTFGGAFLLALAASMVWTSIRNIQEFSFWVVGDFALGIVGMCAAAVGVIILRRTRKQ